MIPPPYPLLSIFSLRIMLQSFLLDSRCGKIRSEKENDKQEETNMKIKIGFASDYPCIKASEKNQTPRHVQPTPRESVVQIYFAERNMNLAYYNDKFDLHCGDIVYVDGKLAGKRGRVTDVNYNFKIKLSDYKRVIAVVDTDVRGRFYMTLSHFISFDRTALPREKVAAWFSAPAMDDDEFVSGRDNSTFRLDDLNGMKISAAVAERGRDYYLGNRVKYISLDGTKGYAIVEGSENYEVEFDYENGEISGLVCSCFCSGNCKHEFAVMLELRDALELIEKDYADEYERTAYFSLIDKASFFSFVINGKDSGSFIL